jgi:peptidoglycan/LPS O-acetylase OafA/YrhL
VTGLVAFAALLYEFWLRLADDPAPGETWPVGIFGYSAIAIFFGAALVLAVTAKQDSVVTRVLGSRLLRVYGTYSYGIYLVHLPVRAVIRDMIYGPHRINARFKFPMIFGTEIVGQLLFDAIVFSLVLSMAWVSYHLFEKRFLALKRFFPSRRAPAPEAAAPALPEHKAA